MAMAKRKPFLLLFFLFCLCAGNTMADELAKKFSEINDQRKGFDTSTAKLERQFLNLLNEYKNPADVARIYVEMLQMYCDSGYTDPSSAVKYAQIAIGKTNDPELQSRIYSQWGHALLVKNGDLTSPKLAEARKEIIIPYLKAIKIALDLHVPEGEVPPPEGTNIRRHYTGPADSPEWKKMQDEAQKLEIELKKIAKLNFIREKRIWAEKGIATIYSRKPYAMDELRHIAADFLKNDPEVNKLAALAQQEFQKYEDYVNTVEQRNKKRKTQSPAAQQPQRSSPQPSQSTSKAPAMHSNPQTQPQFTYFVNGKPANPPAYFMELLHFMERPLDIKRIDEEVKEFERLVDKVDNPRQKGSYYSDFGLRLGSTRLLSERPDLVCHFLKTGLKYSSSSLETINTRLGMYDQMGVAVRMKYRSAKSEELKIHRKEAAEIFLQGLTEALKAQEEAKKVTSRPSPLDPLYKRKEELAKIIAPYFVDGSISAQADRKLVDEYFKLESRLAHNKERQEADSASLKMKDLDGTIKLVIGNIADIYSRAPYDFKELEGLCRQYLRNSDLAKTVLDQAHTFYNARMNSKE